MKYIFLLIVAYLIPFVNSNAQTWKPHNQGIPDTSNLTEVFGIDSSIIVSNSYRGGPSVFYSPDSSSSFQASTLPSGGHLRAFSHYKESIFAFNDKGLFNSVDRGRIWQKINLMKDSNNRIDGIYMDEDTLYASWTPYDGGINVSIDSGKTWKNVSHLYPPGYFYKMLIDNANMYFTYDILYVVGIKRAFLVPMPVGAGVNSLVDFDNAVFIANATHVYRSSDYGDSWSLMFSPVDDTINCMIRVDTSLFIGTVKSGVYRSDKNGINWTQINNGLPGNLGIYPYPLIGSITSLSYNDQYLIALTRGNKKYMPDSSLYVVSLSSLGLNPFFKKDSTLSVIDDSKNAIENIKIYPNPTLNSINIENLQPGDSYYVCDVLGKRNSDIFEAKAANATINLEKLVKGRYYLIIYNSKKISHKILPITKL